MISIQCTVYTVQCTLGSVQCTLSRVYRILYSGYLYLDDTLPGHMCAVHTVYNIYIYYEIIFNFIIIKFVILLLTIP